MESDRTHIDNKNLKFIKHVRSQSTYNIYTYHSNYSFVYVAYTVIVI